MSFLASLPTDVTIEDERDSVGGGNSVLESGIYPATITLAYYTTAASGAIGLNLQFKTEDDRVFRSTQWVQSGDAKGNKTYYVRDGKNYNLPGYSLANSLAVLITGKEIGNLDREEKVINVYSVDVKAEVPTKVQMVMDLLNQPIIVGVLKQVSDKNVKGDDGAYHASGETREENEIDKFFHPDSKMTTTEIKAGAAEAVFINTWSEKWTGVTRDRSTKASGTAGAPKGKGVSTKPTTSLFS